MSITITKIERQKKNKQRYSLYSRNNFIVGISEESLLEFNIHSGLEISQDLLHKIEQKEKYVAIREQAWRFLARRMHSRKELKDKLAAKRHEKDDIDKIIRELENKNYLDDAAFSRQLISDEINLKKSGPLFIKNKLLQKGVEINLISSLLDELYDEQLQYQNCMYIGKKKLNLLREIESHSRRSKLGKYLIQRGFPWDMVNLVLSEMDF